jgi:hypothetical protein
VTIRTPLLARSSLRRRSVPAFIKLMAERHPELRRQVTYTDFLAIASREGIAVRVVALSHRARLIRCGSSVFIQLSKRTNHKERTVLGMHELCHYWRDDPGQPCYYADEQDMRPLEEFADIFAWAVTSTARIYVPGLREEDL